MEVEIGKVEALVGITRKTRYPTSTECLPGITRKTRYPTSTCRRRRRILSILHDRLGPNRDEKLEDQVEDEVAMDITLISVEESEDDVPIRPATATESTKDGFNTFFFYLYRKPFQMFTPGRATTQFLLKTIRSNK